MEYIIVLRRAILNLVTTTQRYCFWLHCKCSPNTLILVTTNLPKQLGF